MSRESAVFVHIDGNVWESSLAPYAREADRAVRKHKKARPGDRRELLRYDAACTQIELVAWQQWSAGAPAVTVDDPATVEELDRLEAGVDVVRRPWRRSLDEVPGPLRPVLVPLNTHLVGRGGAIVELRQPLSSGETVEVADAAPPIPPADPWRAPDGEHGLRAVAARWEGQLEEAMRGRAEPIVPSGVSNKVLTEGLRTFAAAQPARDPVEARVVYRDGSEARPFPLGHLELDEEVPPHVPLFRVALLSLRHPEMDYEVDGAWLRNRDISQMRPQAETDALVYTLSKDQLTALLSHGPRVIHLYQTGLEPAVIGFYRALVRHLKEHPGAITVVPQFFSRRSGFEPGTVWSTKQ